MAFDYETDGPDIETIRSITAEIASAGKPRPPTDAERQEHERFMAECRERDEQRQFEYRRRQEEIANKERVEAERQVAIARAEAKERSRLEYLERTSRQTRDRTLTSLLDASIRSEQYRVGFAKSAQQAASRQRLSKAMDDLINLKNPPPPPEPTVVVSEDDGSADFGSRNFDVAKWAKKPRSWF